MKHLIAITGGIGCGKSVVSQLLRTIGYPVYDADSRARELMLTDDSLHQQLCHTFGQETYLPDGTLNKTYLSAHIFGDAEALRRMNDIVHPCVANDLKQWAEAQASDLAFYESAILFESGFDRFAHRIWSVTAPLELRILRCVQRDRTTRAQVMNRIENQMPQEEKDRRAHSVIINDRSHSIIVQVNALLKELQSES